jgi:hypothetical protein
VTTCIQVRCPTFFGRGPDTVRVTGGTYTIRYHGWLHVVNVPGQTGIVEGWYGVEDDWHVVMNVRVTCELVGPHPVYGDLA